MQCVNLSAKKRSTGSNCCIPQCHTISTKCRVLSFVRIPRKGVSDEQDRWREALIRAVDRIDKSFNVDKAKICSRHFDEGCLTYGPSGKCSGLMMWSMPTHWMPSKSIETPKTSRPKPIVREPPPVPERVYYWNFEDLRQNSASLAPPWFVKENTVNAFKVALDTDSGPQVTVEVNAATGLQAEVKVFGIRLPAAQLSTNLGEQSLKKFLDELQSMTRCAGVTDKSLQHLSGPPDGKSQYFQHLQYEHQDGQVRHVSCVRSIQCQGLLSPQLQSQCCKPCKHAEHLLKQKNRRQDSRMLQPMKRNDPLHSIQPEQLKAAFKQERQEKTQLLKELKAFKDSMPKHSIELSKEMHEDLNAVDTSNLDDPLQKLFWEEQQKSFQHKGRGMRWHPMTIRLAILLHSKSKAAYETLRKTGVLKLPGSSTLREYTAATEHQEGFQAEVMEELRKEAEKLDDHNRFVVLLHDEMKIKSDLVFDPRTGKMVGFANKDQWSFKCVDEKLSTQALVFYVVGVSSHIKMSVAYFGTRSATADQLMPLFWKAVGCIEECGLKVIASTSDKASPNQRLYQLHQLPCQPGVCYKAVNIFAPDREIFFISDPPHLIKTVRNNLESSGKPTRLLWKDGHLLLWQHIVDVYNMDMRIGLRRTALKKEHVHLNPHSKMDVRLAAQVLSQRVGKVMKEYGPPDCQETGEFVRLMYRYFDCLNSRHLYEAERTRKPDMLPYTDVADCRFNFLQTEFLGYLEAWQASVDNRPGNFTKTHRQKMCLTHQTVKGLTMTVHGFVGATKFLLSQGVQFVLSNKFCQDPIEEHFGRHRAMGRTAENPGLLQFGHQEGNLRLQRHLALMVTPRGNVKGAHHQRPKAIMSNSPVKKKKKN